MDVSVLLIEQMLLNDSEWLTSFNFVIDIHTCWEEDCAHIGFVKVPEVSSMTQAWMNT